MKKPRTHVTRFLIVAAALICGYFTLTTGRTAGVDSMKNSAGPAPGLRGPAAIRHLEQTGLPLLPYKNLCTPQIASYLMRGRSRDCSGVVLLFGRSCDLGNDCAKYNQKTIKESKDRYCEVDPKNLRSAIVIGFGWAGMQ
jgi:hypothetical protein